MGEKLTVQQVLEITIRNLKAIMVPVELSESIGQVLLGSIRNLEACVNAMNEQSDGGDGDGSDPDSE